MNPQVEELINRKKVELSNKQKAHLWSLDLIDTSSIEVSKVPQDMISARKIDGDWFPFNYNGEVKYTYKRYFAPIDISDDEYAELCKYYPPVNDVDNNDTVQTDIHTIKNWVVFFGVITVISLVIGIIIALI